MTISAASAIYRVRIATAGSTVVAGNVAATLTQADDLAEVPVLNGPTVDLLECTSVSSPFRIRCKSDAALFTSTDGSGRMVTLGRLAEVQRSVDGSTYSTLGTGRISYVSETERGLVDVEVMDERWMERRADIFRTTTTMQLAPPGLTSAWRDSPAAGTAAFTVTGATTSGNAVQITTVPNESDQGSFPDQISRIPVALSQALLGDLKRSYYIGSTGAGSFTNLRFADGTTSPKGVISFQYSLNAPHYTDPSTPLGPLGPLAPNGGDGLLRYAWVSIPGSTYNVGDQITGRFYWAGGVDANETVPVHIGGATGVHPMQLMKDVLDGTYGGDAVRYSTSAMAALTSLSLRPVWARIGTPVERAEWLEKNVYRPYMVAPMVGTDLVARPTSLRQPQNEDPDTYTELTASNASIPTWEHTSRDIRTVVALKFKRATKSKQQNLGSIDWPADDYEVSEWSPPPIEHDNVNTLGKIVHEVATDLMLESYVWPDVQNELAQEIFSVFGDGAQRGEIEVADNAGVEVGDFVSLDHDTLKGFNPTTGARSGNRIVQLVSFREMTPASTIFEYLDHGPHAQPLSAPTISISQSTSLLDYVDVAVSGLGTGELAAVEVDGGTTTAPSSFRLARSGIGNSTVSFELGEGYGNAYVRARAMKPGRISSAWATTFTALSARGVVERATVTREIAGAADIKWTVKTGTAGMLTDYDTHGRTESPTFGSNVAHYSSTVGGFSITGPIATRDALTVKLTPYTGWGGSTVSGTAGSPVEVENIFPRTFPGGRTGALKKISLGPESFGSTAGDAPLKPASTTGTYSWSAPISFKVGTKVLSWASRAVRKTTSDLATLGFAGPPIYTNFPPDYIAFNMSTGLIHSANANSWTTVSESLDLNVPRAAHFTVSVNLRGTTSVNSAQFGHVDFTVLEPIE